MNLPNTSPHPRSQPLPTRAGAAAAGAEEPPRANETDFPGRWLGPFGEGGEPGGAAAGDAEGCDAGGRAAWGGRGESRDCGRVPGASGAAPAGLPGPLGRRTGGGDRRARPGQGCSPGKHASVRPARPRGSHACSPRRRTRSPEWEWAPWTGERTCTSARATVLPGSPFKPGGGDRRGGSFTKLSSVFGSPKRRELRQRGPAPPGTAPAAHPGGCGRSLAEGGRARCVCAAAQCPAHLVQGALGASLPGCAEVV